jgi:hypothetical protein
MGIFSKLSKKKKENDNFHINPNDSPELKEAFDAMINELTSFAIGEFIKSFYIDIPGVVESAGDNGYNIDEEFEYGIFKDVQSLLEKSTDNYKKDYGKFLWPSIVAVLIERFNLNMKDVAIRNKIDTTTKSIMNVILEGLKTIDTESLKGESNGAK